MTSLYAILGRGMAGLESSLELLNSHVVSEIEGCTSIHSDSRKFQVPWVAVNPVTRATEKVVAVRRGRLSPDDSQFEVCWKVPREGSTGFSSLPLGIITLQLFIGRDVSGVTLGCATSSIEAQLDLTLEYLKPAFESEGLMLLKHLEPLTFVEILSRKKLTLEWEEYECFEHDDASLDFDWLVDRLDCGSAD